MTYVAVRARTAIRWRGPFVLRGVVLVGLQAGDEGDSSMDRRTFIGGVASGLIVVPRFARAQPAVPLIGFVRSSSLDDVGDLVVSFRQGLEETRLPKPSASRSPSPF